MSAEKSGKFDFERFLRKAFKHPLDWLASRLLKLGITPNHITLFGLVGNIGAAVLIALGYLSWGGLVAGLMAPLDAVDGAMARLKGETSKFGAFLDSVIDRYDELFLFGGLIVYFYNEANFVGILLTFLAATGAVMVSYTRARAEGLGLDAKTGILTRIERSIVLIIGLLFSKPIYSVGIIAVLANVTAIQRICHVWQQTKAD
ncbi:MAG: CDP-alcohol phosphatidyltransferase family protein [Anaerolineaceae bacterium]|jgi:CDP-diacylglycerol--glycerol-3-phosphate 3-phosphatidyltransferase|nr:CDP-alcohol phosphatidyltransferase family protein [Anaerolineaceae bacterium]MDD4042962.1 CDP-alcohol phosphatidyltransferase family protein [Anaerolineaceae bacterium]MDD4578093.1 CDP-alcohol phosphatidyltransferase family protein [Anaerolineaceae bacterium]